MNPIHDTNRSATFRIALAIAAVIALSVVGLRAEPVSTAIKIDNFGYRTADVKVGVFSQDPGATVEVRPAAGGATVHTISGSAITSKGSDGSDSGDTIWWADFSSFTTPGSYHLYSPAIGGQSYDFEIRDDIYNQVVLTALKTFYYQRCNTPKDPAHAGAWADNAACHMTDLATTNAAGHTNHGPLDLTGGWHDAGDYNKYAWTAVSSAILQMLRAYEDNPGNFADADLNIPESGNGVPDILDEIKYELDWLLKMQLSDGSVLHQMHVDGFGWNSPPSADTASSSVRFYQNANDQSGAVFAGSLALASRIFAAEGMTAYSDTLKTAALNAWSWLRPRSNTLKEKVWAAAEIFRLDPTQTSAKNYVDNYHPSNWPGVFFDPLHYDTHAATTYIQAPGATAAVVTNMRANVAWQVGWQIGEDDLYRNGMPSWAYFWGSNQERAAIGLFLLQAVKLGETGGFSPQQITDKAQDYFHFFHGQNALGMMYLTNMGALGGEHASWQIYHGWFGASENPFSASNFIGKPAGIVEPDYPYYKGTDNHGVSDNKVSLQGPAPGFVPGGPNMSYTGTAIPPQNETLFNRAYRDWSDQIIWTAQTWEITETSIGYQGPYVALGAYFMGQSVPQCSSDPDSDDGLFCNGPETCNAGSCSAGPDPCPGEACDDDSDSCVVSACDNDGTCETGEDCASCPNDCAAGVGPGPGNGICEPSIGENCLNTSDCRGKTNGKQSNRYCCGDGGGPGPVGCSDNRCTAEGFACSDQPVVAFCCGDAICDSGENGCGVCELDCTVPASELVASTCSDSQDNDCDGFADCSDVADCSADPFCDVPPPACDNDGVCEPGEDCNNCANDCDGRTNGKPSRRYCCGNGLAEGAEGSGSICDGNF